MTTRHDDDDNTAPQLSATAADSAEGIETAGDVSLEPVLGRFTDGFPAHLACGPGWYQIVVRLDRAIAQLCPTYELHQVKEKFGTLRFYWEFPPLRPHCCIDRDMTDPYPYPRAPWPTAAARNVDHRLIDDWVARDIAHCDTAHHISADDALDVERGRREYLGKVIDAFVRRSEQTSSVTCETCGAPGTLAMVGGWYKTRCHPCR
jgi:hypothetical protein